MDIFPAFISIIVSILDVSIIDCLRYLFSVVNVKYNGAN